MDESIDAAIVSEEEISEEEPPRKKRRVDPSIVLPTTSKPKVEEAKGFFAFFSPTDKSVSLRRDLRRLVSKHPDLNLSHNNEIDALLETLNEDQLKSLLDNVRFQIGVKSPNGNGLSFLGIAGDLLDRSIGTRQLSKKLMEDTELVEWVEDLVPSDMTWLSVPFRIVNRILCHAQQAYPTVEK